MNESTPFYLLPEGEKRKMCPQPDPMQRLREFVAKHRKDDPLVAEAAQALADAVERLECAASGDVVTGDGAREADDG